MFKAIAGVIAGYAALLTLGVFWPTLAGLPWQADHAFPMNADYTATLEPLWPMRKILKRFGLSDEEAKAGHPIVFGDKTPDGGFQIQLLDRRVTPGAWQEKFKAGGRAIDPNAGPVMTLHPEGDVSFTGTVTMLGKSPHVYAFEFDAVDGLLAIKKPQGCVAFEVGGNLLLALAGANPNKVFYCSARSERTGKKAVLSFYTVDSGFLTRLYTNLRCALIHDEIAARLGSSVVGQEHVCMEFRTDTSLSHDPDPVSLRHFLFATPG